MQKVLATLGVLHLHRYLRKIDCSLAVVGGPATAYSHGKSMHWPSIKCQSVFMGVGDTTTTVNNLKQADNEQSMSLRCLWVNKIPQQTRVIRFGEVSRLL